MSHQKLYIGTYTQPILFGTGDILEGKGKGIYLLDLDEDTGALAIGQVTGPAPNPSYLCLTRDRRFLYAVNELKEFQGQPCGGVTAYRVDRENGALTFINSRPTGGTDPCHVAVNSAGTHVYVSNFMSGSVCVFPIAPDGSLSPESFFIQHQGRSVVESRQSGPHAHSLVFAPDERFAFVPDLGIDRLMIYRTDFQSGSLVPGPVPSFRAEPGSGPRFCEFHRNGRFCYLINEIASTISLLAYDGDGHFKPVQSIDTVPENCKEGNICADLHLTPDGRFLYGSNRGHDSISVYAVDPESGRLTWLDNTPCGGRTPRNFCIDLTGRYLICGNQDSDSIVTFCIHEDTGKLTKVYELELPTPVCVKPVRF